MSTAVAEGEPLWKVADCDSCHRPIVWAITRNANKMPVDAVPPLTGGNVALEYRGASVPPLAHVLSVTRQFGRTNLRTNHMHTCPDRAAWKGGRARRSRA